jgi:amino acid transporter
MSATSPVRPSAVSQALARDRLGVPSVIMFALTAAAPLMVVGALISTAWGQLGITGFPLAFALMFGVLALFSFGYVAMSRHVRNAGAFYSYITQGLGRPLGVGASLVALLAYNMLQVGLYGAFGAFLAPYLEQKFGWKIDWWVLALALWVFVAILGLLRVEVNSRVLMVLLGAEILVVTVFDVIFFSHPDGGSISFQPWTWDALNGPTLGPALVVCITAYVGFEAAPVFSEESKSPGRTVAVATFLGLFVMLAAYAITSWAASVSIGVDKTVKASQDTLDTGGPFFPTLAQHGGGWLIDVGQILLLTSVSAAALSYHNTCARYAFALGRERVLPSFFGRTRARSGAPQAGSLFQSLIGLVVIVVFAIKGWDPLVQLFFWLGTTGGLGILFLIAFTSLSVIFYFARDRRGENAWSWLIAPILATAALGLVIYYALDNFYGLLGVDPKSNLRWEFPLSYGVVAAIGIIWALILRVTRPRDYQAIGLGQRAVTVRQETFDRYPPDRYPPDRYPPDQYQRIR